MADLKSLKTQYKNLSSTLQESPTAYSGADPSDSDISTQRKMIALNQKLERAKSEELKKGYYGEEDADTPDDATTGVKKKGALGRALQVLSAGVTVPVGIIEAATGKGTKKGVFENVNSNFEEGETYGDLLRKFGVQNNAVASGVGFALDIALDPVNWATAGTAALIPRIGKGALKAGLTGAKEGLVSGVLQKATTLAKPLKSFGATGKYANIVKKAAETGAQYEKTIGFDLAAKLEKGGILNGVISNAIEGIKESPAGNTMKHFLYSTKDWYNRSKAFEDLAAESNSLRAFKPDELKSMIRQKAGEILDNPSLIKNLETSGYDIRKAAEARVQQSLNAGADLATIRPDLGTFANKDDAVKAFADEAIDDLALRNSAARLKEAGISEDEALQFLKSSKEVGEGNTGIGWYDKMGDYVKENFKVGNVEVGKKLINGYKTAIDLFKIQKIGSPSTLAYSVLGNAVMAGMSGMDILNKTFFKTLKEGLKWAQGKPTLQSLMDLMENPSVRELAEKYPETFRKSFGFNPKLFLNNDTINEAIKGYEQLTDAAISAEQRFQITESIAALRNEWDSTGLAGQLGKKEASAALSPLAQGMKADVPVAMAETTAISNELNRGGAAKFIKKLEDIANNPGKMVEKVGENGKKIATVQRYSDAQRFGAKALHWYLTKPIGAFEKVDQTFKIGNFLHLTRDGITRNELERMSKWGRFKLGDEVFAGNDGLYRFTADKAAEVANEIYMNYSAMPGAVKVLRSMPFFGSPFASFSYAMLAKTGKTAANNLSFFNKVQYALKELGGGKSPLEKDNLANNKYYQWYNKDGMVSLPWWRENPMYINLASFIPYYTMNIFQNSDRSYTKNLQGGLAQAIDGIPFLKTPEGQVFTDYFLMPALMQQTNPEGSFGQKLYPSDASAFEKYVAYPARGLSEAVVPPFASQWSSIPIATAANAVSLPDEAVSWLPSYRARQLTFATRGKSSLGIQSSEPAISKRDRAIAAIYMGLNTYSMNLNQSK